MGKKQHQKDKLWLTTTEWSTLYGGRSAANKGSDRRKFRRLPFHCCAISFTPFETPFATRSGAVFELANILPFLKQHGVDPVTGKKLGAKDLVQLHFHRNAEGKFHCPITYKVFTESSHIVAVATSGHVYSWEAVDQLNLRPNSLRDLLTDAPFTRADLIEIQNPRNLDRANITAFHHVRHKAEAKARAGTSGATVRAPNLETRETLSQLAKDFRPTGEGFASQSADGGKSGEGTSRKRDRINAAHFSTGRAAASLTSTVMPVTTRVEAAVLADDAVRYPRVKRKAYVRLVTSHGNLNVELAADLVPRTCENFLLLCRRRYLDDTPFHRLIRHFMVQGGDPTGDGTGGSSAWGEPFADEFHQNLRHEGRGVLSMANSGKDSNRSQFFITFRSCRHLDRKHAVFGRVVGGLDTLDAIEAVETDAEDKPIEDVRLLATHVFVDPFEEVDAQIAAEREADREEEEARRKEEEEEEAKPEEKEEPGVVYRKGVGKFLNLKKVAAAAAGQGDGPERKKKKVAARAFSDFSAF